MFRLELLTSFHPEQMENFTIQINERKNSYRESIEFQAIDKEGKPIFGASAELSRGKEFGESDKWENWQINYGTCGSMSYEEKLPYVSAINEAMEKLRELSA